MGRPISLFSGYSNAENRTTNYCLLVLKLLYEDNPKFLAEALGEEAGGSIGVAFRQQEHGKSSVPDGVITQSPLTIAVETKNFDWFYNAQIEAHLRNLSESPGCRVLVALSNFEGEPAWAQTARTRCEKAGVELAVVSFEDLVQAIKRPGLPKNLADMVLELEAYLTEQGLLPIWKRRLDVANCAQLFANLDEGGVYICPATGSYSHKRSRYFGMYRFKRIEKVALIRAVVDINAPDQEALVRWKNTEEQDRDLVEEARSKRNQYRPEEMPARVFVLGPLYETDCRKESPGGMIQSKRYFDIGDLRSGSAEELANALRATRLDDLSALP